MSPSMLRGSESSKTDQCQGGVSLVIAHTGQVTCPVGMMEHYFCMGVVETTHPRQSSFGGQCRPKEENVYVRMVFSVTTRLRELLLE